MRRAEEAGTQECPVKIKLVAPPLYVLTTQTLEKVSFSTHWWILYLWFLPHFLVISLVFGCVNLPVTFLELSTTLGTVIACPDFMDSRVCSS